MRSSEFLHKNKIIKPGIVRCQILKHASPDNPNGLVVGVSQAETSVIPSTEELTSTAVGKRDDYSSRETYFRPVLYLS